NSGWSLAPIFQVDGEVARSPPNLSREQLMDELMYHVDNLKPIRRGRASSGDRRRHRVPSERGRFPDVRLFSISEREGPDRHGAKADRHSTPILDGEPE